MQTSTLLLYIAGAAGFYLIETIYINSRDPEPKEWRVPMLIGAVLWPITIIFLFMVWVYLPWRLGQQKKRL